MTIASRSPRSARRSPPASVARAAADCGVTSAALGQAGVVSQIARSRSVDEDSANS
jgi:hypothetical protein